MEFLMRGGSDFQLLYNCSFYDLNVIPLGERRNIPLGIGLIIVLGVEMILYMPCLVSIWSRREHTCYKFMFVMGILDMIHLLTIGPFSGVFSIVGAVYCSNPMEIYISGAISMGVNIGQKLMDLLLAINRCSYFVIPKTALKVFPEQKRWTWCWTLVPVSIGVGYTIFGTQAIFSGISGWWMWNPHYGYANEIYELYSGNRSLMFYNVLNYMMAIALPTIYLAFSIGVLKESLWIGDLHGQRKTSAIPVFKQVATISVVQCVAAILGLYQKHLNNPSKILSLGHLCFETQTCGIAPVIYLSFNKKIQKDVKRMGKKLKKLLLTKTNQVSTGNTDTR